MKKDNLKTMILFNDKEYIGVSTEEDADGFVYTGKISFYESVTFDISNISSLSLGGDSHNDIILEGDQASLRYFKKCLSVLQGDIYHNGMRTNKKEIRIEDGEAIFTGMHLLSFHGNQISVFGTYDAEKVWTMEAEKLSEDFPFFKRPPRIIKRMPEEMVNVIKPEQKEKKEKGGLAKLVIPPLVTVASTVAIGIMMKRAIYVYFMAATTIVTTIFSITNYIQNKKEAKIREEKRKADYENYLLGLRKKLYGLYERQREAMLYNAPSVKETVRLAREYSTRIYERAAGDGDFLTVSLGTVNVASSYKISYEENELSSNDDSLLEEMKEICRNFTTVPDMPCVIDLKKAHLALVGEKNLVHAQLKRIIVQICFFQSYHDVEIVMLTEEEDKEDFSWLRWFGHCRISSINMSGLISSETARDQVLGNLSQILKSREEKKEEAKKETAFLPYFIFIIDNQKLTQNHNIMEYLQKEDMVLDFSIIITSQFQATVPENIKTVFRVDGHDDGTLILNEGLYENRHVKLENTDDADFEGMARSLYPIQHQKGITSALPEQVTFFELYGIEQPQELNSQVLWQKNACHKSLAVPFGVRGRNDIMYLNLHEKAHGPHGLIAGTTGSGKSELIQTYILSLAVNFHPHEVGFLLIDYKGGGMANLFDSLPHLLGKITNLDGSESMRALLSIRSELKRRQKIFGEYNVNSINQYTKLFRNHEAKEPLPHLFIISDEFAELKKEQPEFISELVSTARIGRSLGVHLILATQKPSGVVDDQIWSNSRFKLALKVQNESDSNEILKTPDAAKITQPGRAYLQVGNNEIYELFQSAWSGAPYKAGKSSQEVDDRVYLINELGQRELINEDLSVLTEEDSKETQLDAVVLYLKDVYDKQACIPVRRPWLDPLPDKLITPHLKKIGDVAKCTEYCDNAAIGIVDFPEQQSQKEYVHDFSRDGNLAVFGASGFGKSTVIMNLILTLAAVNSPQMMNFYILDFGNSALIQLKNLVHTADYINFDDTEKLKKLIKLMDARIKERKQAFARTASINFKMYNQLAEEKFPMIILFIDNYDAVKETEFDMEEFLARLSRDGASVGIFLVISASRPNVVRYSVLNNFKNRVSLYMFDSSDILSVVGRSQFTLPEKKGRALVKQQTANIMQSYLPVEYVDDLSYAKKIHELIENISHQCSAPKAEGIPVLPDHVTTARLPKTSKGFACVGLESEEVIPVHLDLRENNLIIGTSRTGKTNILQLILNQKKQAKIFLVDSKAEELIDYAGLENTEYLPSGGDVDAFRAALAEFVRERKEEFMKQEGIQRAKEFYGQLKEAVILIDDVDNFIKINEKKEKEMEQVLKAAFETGIGMTVTIMPGKLRGFDMLTPLFKEIQNGFVLGNPTEQGYFQIPLIRGYQPEVDKGILVSRGKTWQVKIAKADD